MRLQSEHFKRMNSTRNPALIESWCGGCGSFIGAAGDHETLQIAESSHDCQHPPASSREGSHKAKHHSSSDGRPRKTRRK